VKHPGLIVFDIDGTLLQTGLVTVPAVQRTFAAFGLPIPAPETICGFFGKPTEDYEAWIATLCPDGMAQTIIEATNTLELNLIGGEGELYSGAREVLRGLREEGYVLAICSNGPDAYVAEFLDAHEVRSFFREVRTRGTKYDGKETMLREILACIPARPAIVVGDRHDDISAAHANGALAIGAAYGFGSQAELHDADAVAARAADIPAAIEELLNR